jgi:CubicO group peptidase (beta-lactamase class C family)
MRSQNTLRNGRKEGSMRFLDREWIELADELSRRTPAAGGSPHRVEFVITDPLPDGPDRVALDADLDSGGLWLGRPRAAGESSLRLRLPRSAAARILLGSARQRVEAFDRGDIEAEGYFALLFFVDRMLQQDYGRLLAGLRAATTDGPPAAEPDPPPASAAEEDPDRLAEAEAALPKAMHALRSEIGQSTPGAQLYVSRRGRPLASVGLGECRPGVPYRHDSRTLWYCCAKPVVAVAIGQLWERGLVDPYAPVSRYLPDFTGPGREDMTLVQILTHTTPVPTGADPLHGSLTAPAELRWRRAAAVQAPHRPPRRSINYSQWWSWTLLARVIEAADGRPIDRYLTEEVLGPCDLAATRVRLSDREYDELGDRLPLIHIAGDGRPAQPTWWFATRAGATECLPGVNVRGPMADLGRFFEMLLAGGLAARGRVLAAPTVAALTARHRTGLTDGFGNADWGLGFRLECGHLDPELTGFSSYSSPRSYGHDGLWTAVAFADPEADLAVALHLNGKTGHQTHGDRMRRILDAVYEDVMP